MDTSQKKLERAEKLRRPMKWVYAFLVLLVLVGAFTGNSGLFWGALALALITASVTLTARYI